MPLPALLLSLWLLFATDTNAPDSPHVQILQAEQALFTAAMQACDAGQATPALAANLAFMHNRIEQDHLAAAEDCRQQRGGSSTVRQPVVLPQAVATLALQQDAALQWGRHRYYALQADGHAQLTGEAGFVHLWRRVDGRWQLQRALGYGTPPPR